MLGWLAWREDRRLGPRSWSDRRWAVASGVFFAVDLILWHHSIGDIGAGLATVLANIQVVLVPLVAWALLSERPGARVLAALPISLLGVPLISGVLERRAYGQNPTRGAIFGLGAGVAYVGFLLLLPTADPICADRPDRCSRSAPPGVLPSAFPVRFSPLPLVFRFPLQAIAGASGSRSRAASMSASENSGSSSSPAR